MIRLTIHTSTYNRGYILEKAYQSLKEQTCRDFEWIITDDGSIDETEALVEKWTAESAFPIVYNRLEHVGIPRALNSGMKLARSDWFMLLDSDDYLVPEAVEKILGWMEEIQDDPDIAGIGYARCFPNGEYMKPQIPLIDPMMGYVDATNIERAKYNLDMDMMEAYKLKVLRRYPYQVWKDEEFAPEQLSYNQMALAGYKIRWRSDKLYICDYLEDGLTRDDSIVMKNPMGYAMMHNQNLLIYRDLKSRCRNAMQMIALALYAGNPSYCFKTNDKFATFLMFPLGVALSFRRRCQFSKLRRVSNNRKQ